MFLQDSFEVIDKDAPDYFENELYTPHLIKNLDESQRKVLKFVGNIVIPGKHVKKIQLDKRIEKIYRERYAAKIDEMKKILYSGEEEESKEEIQTSTATTS